MTAPVTAPELGVAEVLEALAGRCDHARSNLGVFACQSVMADAHEALEGTRDGWVNDYRTIQEYAAALRSAAEAARSGGEGL